MNKSKFHKPPLSNTEKEKKAEEFLGFLDSKNINNKKNNLVRNFEKEQISCFTFRVPQTLHDDLKEITALTGISINAICLELLRPNIKRKLKELKNDTE